MYQALFQVYFVYWNLSKTMILRLLSPSYESTQKYVAIAQYIFGDIHLFHYSVLPPSTAMNRYYIEKENLESVHLLDASKNCWKKRTKFLLKIGGILIPRDSFILLLLSDSYTLRFWKRLTSRLQRQPTLLVTETILKKPGTVHRCQPGQTHAMDWWLYPNALSISSSPTSFTDTTLQMLILPS